MRSSTLGIRRRHASSQQGKLDVRKGQADNPKTLATEANFVKDRRSAFQAGRGSGFSGSSFHGSGFFDNFASAIAASARAGHVTAAVLVTVATTATMTTVAEQALAAVATMTSMATTMTTRAAHVAIAATAGRVAAHAAMTAAATMTTMASHRGLLTTEQRDADDREKDRDSENHNTIHSKFLQVTSQVP